LLNKVKLDDTDEHLHLRINQPPSFEDDQSLHLAGWRIDKKHDDPLDSFEVQEERPPVVTEYEPIICGGTGEPQGPNEEIQKIVDDVITYFKLFFVVRLQFINTGFYISQVES
jgi:hypothetical protein